MSTHPTTSADPAGLPPVITGYIDAANAGRTDDAARCFADDAIVHDENRAHRGRAAIRGWIDSTTAASHPRNKVLSADLNGETHTVISEISGDFPGSPIELELRFTISGGKISSLDIR